MKKLKQMTKEDIELVIKLSYLLGELNKKYKYPHGKNPMGIIIYALEEAEKRKKEAKM